MQDIYKPLTERIPDTQYRDNLRMILEHGTLIENTMQGVGALSCFGTTQKMVFDLSNGFPLITGRKLGPMMAIREMTAFINGVRDINEMSNAWGCKFWDEYRGKGTIFGMDPDDMGSASYGPAFTAYPMPDGRKWNQFDHTVRQLRKFPHLKTIRITPWIPFLTARGNERKVIVAPCHGDMFFQVVDDRLNMTMVQRSADMALGVPNNTVQYAALLLMLAQVTGLKPGTFIHDLVDAHIYLNQKSHMEEYVLREPLPFPSMEMDPSVFELVDFRSTHFTLKEYQAHPAMPDIPYSP